MSLLECGIAEEQKQVLLLVARIFISFSKSCVSCEVFQIAPSLFHDWFTSSPDWMPKILLIFRLMGITLVQSPANT